MGQIKGWWGKKAKKSKPDRLLEFKAASSIVRVLYVASATQQHPPLKKKAKMVAS